MKTFFGLNVIEIRGSNVVEVSDIKKLPFYEFWAESSSGSTMLVGNDGRDYVSLIDWEKFCELFIRTGKHRYQLPYS